MDFIEWQVEEHFNVNQSPVRYYLHYINTFFSSCCSYIDVVSMISVLTVSECSQVQFKFY